MGWRGTAILAVLIVVVGGLLWFEEQAEKPTGPGRTLLGEPERVNPDRPVKHLLEFAPADVVRIELEHDGRVRSATRRNGHWDRAPDAMDDFLTNLAELGVLMDIQGGQQQLKDFGLQPPQSVVRLHVGGRSDPLVLQIGDRNPAVTGAYVRIGGTGPVVLAGALVAWEFDQAFKALAAADAQ